MHPIITIAICAHNSENTICALFLSLKQQIDKRFTILLVDNHSVDKTIKIVKENFEDLPIRIVEEDRIGIQNARNRALKEIKTRYFSFVDSDDVLSKNYVKYLCENIHDKVLPSVNYMSFIDGAPIPIPKEQCGKYFLYPQKGQGYSFDTFKGIYQGFLWNKLFDKNIIDEYQIDFDSEIAIGEDSLFIDKYISHIEKIILIKEQCYLYRIRKDSLTNTEAPNKDHIRLLLTERKRFAYLDQTLDKKSNAYAMWAKRKCFYLKRFSSYYRELDEEFLIPQLRQEAFETLKSGLSAKRKSFSITFQLLLRYLLFKYYFK